MKSIPFAGFVALGALAIAGLTAASIVACSSDPDPVAAGCDSAKCLTGNSCIAVKGETKCRLQCTAQTCPFNYSCVVNEEGKGYCAENKTKLTEVKGQQWGAPCNASGGLDANPSCDTSQQFQCFGESPSDANAYCTRYNCSDDSDCAGGFWCATVDKHPDVTTLARTFNETIKVCKKRDFCSPCTRDLDCSPQVDGRPSKCVKDAKGQGLCSRACDTDQACIRPDVKCDQNACVPRAGQCKGDGSLCSPCQSDADCKNGGLCLTAEYSTERYCGFKSPTACSSAGNSCPKENVANARVGCYTGGELKDQCTGFYRVGDQLFPGCFSAERACETQPPIGGASCSTLFAYNFPRVQTTSAAAPPALNGGLLYDGVYVLATSTVYGATIPKEVKRTVRVSGCGKQFEFAEETRNLPPQPADAGADAEAEADAAPEAGPFDAGAPVTGLLAGTATTATGGKLIWNASCPKAETRELSYKTIAPGSTEAQLHILTSGPSGPISLDIYERR